MSVTPAPLTPVADDPASVRVLLVDDQPMVGETVRRMLATDPTIEFVYCSDPTQALPTAVRVRPTVILQDLVMPDIDGLTLVKFYRRHPATADVPVVVLSGNMDETTKAESFAVGASDYIVKNTGSVELVARVKHHSRGYLNLLQRNAAYLELDRSRKQLADELAAGLRYVLSLLPPKQSGHISLDYRFVPTSQMGGDAVGYQMLDPDHLALYLLDVTGHGLGSALLSVTVQNSLRTATLPNTDFRHPGQVLFGLNEAYPCEKHGEKFFTIWYGVYHIPTRTLKWSGAGHPDALLFAGDQPPQRLTSNGPMLGMMPWPEFEVSEVVIPPDSRLYIYSDGAHEIHKTDGTDWQFEEFVGHMAKLVRTTPDDVMDQLHRDIVALHGSNVLDDDMTILEVRFR